MSIFDRITTGVGIDVSEHHIRLAHVSWLGSVKDTFEIELPDGLIVDDKVVRPEEIKKILKQKLGKVSWAQSPLRTTLLIPDSRVFYSGFMLPKSLKGDALQTEALSRAQKQIPVPFSKARTDITQGDRLDDSVRTTVYAVEQEVINGFQDIFSETPLNIMAIEANSKAVFRLVQKYPHNDQKNEKNSEGVIVVADLGRQWMTMSVYTQKGSCLYSRSVSYAHSSKENNDKEEVSKSVVDIVSGALQETVIYSTKNGMKIQHVLLSGVEAWGKSFELLSKKKIEEVSLVRLGDILSVHYMSAKDVHVFGAAVGAALRASFPMRYGYQHNLIF